MEITLTGIEKAIAALKRITKMGFRPSFDRFHQEYLRRTFRSRFLTAAEQTPYAPGSLGTRKSVSRVVRGGADDPGFGIDSRTLLKEVSGETQGGVQISDTVLELMSVTPYAPFVYEKFKTKGPFAPGGIFDLEGSDIEPLFDLAAQQIEQEWLRD